MVIMMQILQESNVHKALYAIDKPCVCSCMHVDSLLAEPQGKHKNTGVYRLFLL